MSRIILCALFSCILFSGLASAQDRGFGVGVIIGEPTGLSLKGWLDGSTAIDGAAAWSFGKNDSLHIHMDYLVHKFDIVRVRSGQLPLYYGIGGRIKFEDPDSKVGFRIPLGANYLFANDPLDVFFEIAPVLDIAPATDVSINGGVGIRYYFR